MVGIKRTEPFFVFSSQLESYIIVINLQKGNITFLRKIPASYKYWKIVKITVYVFKHTRILRVFRKHKAQEIKVEYLRYNNFPFLEIKTS